MSVRRVITGLDAEGRSTVREDGAPPLAFRGSIEAPPTRTEGSFTDQSVPPGEAVVHQLWAIGTHAAMGAPDPTRTMTHPEFNTPPGETSWIITEMGPGLEAEMHRTDTIDYGLVVRGEVELGLETGPIVLRAGDSVLVDGVLHSWRAGPEGCLIATVQVGLAAEER